MPNNAVALIYPIDFMVDLKKFYSMKCGITAFSLGQEKT
jgi:hypothetical protein